MRGIENYLIKKLGYNQVFMYNTIFVKIDGVWKKAKAHIKLTAWKKGLVWHKDSNNTWSK